MRQIPNTAISASAGTGKTFQLAHRYIRLMAAGVPPGRITALTFSRKAAGEIFESIVENLCEAATDSAKAEHVETIIGSGAGGQEAFFECLKKLVHNLHKLNIGTLDSFIMGIIRAFPTELGIPPDFNVFDNDGTASQLMRRRVITKILNPSLVGIAAQKKFLESFKQATFGFEEKDMGNNLDRFVSSLKQFYDLAPESARWGREDAVWPEGHLWQDKVRGLGNAEERVKEWASSCNADRGMLNSLEKIVDFAANYDSFSLWDSSIENVVFDQLMSQISSLQHGGQVEYKRKTVDIPAKISGELFKLLSNLMHVEIQRCLNQTRGLHKVLSRYSRMYNEVSLAKGNLTFEDAQHLLSRTGGSPDGMQISRTKGGVDRLYIDYRLNCRLDHWLLDEFQDTSYLQWNALSNIADEIIQDNTGTRSFFYVGDVKQAIYGWRGGNHKLFGRLLNRYRGNIEPVPLTESFRSSPPVIKTVNTVFGNLNSPGLPAETVREWQSYWTEHTCSSRVPARGYACFLTVPKKKRQRDSKTSIYEHAAAILAHVQPLNRRLSAGILVRTNDEGKELVNVLRRKCPGLPVVHEGKATIRDNPVVELVLSIVTLAAHPGDELAWRHVCMSPVRPLLHSEGFNRHEISLRLQEMIHHRGFRRFVQYWASVIEKAVDLDFFAKMRISDLVVAAEEFDSTQAPECNAFLRFIDNYSKHEESSDAAIRVMTYHQAKGLDFDMVILPDLLGNSLFKPRLQDLLVGGEPESPDWLLKAPRKAIAEGDANLSAAVNEERARRCYGELCTLYVGLTRARYALYMIGLDKAGENSISSFLCGRLAGPAGMDDSTSLRFGEYEPAAVYEQGERDWHTAIKAGKSVAEPETSHQKPVAVGQKALQRIEPSYREELNRSVSFMFDAGRRQALETGTAIHSLFEKVGWIEECNIEDMTDQWLAGEEWPEEVTRVVIPAFQKAVNSPAVAEALSRPAVNSDLWREKHFEVLLDGKLVSGVFDRVTIDYSADGKVENAQIFDFKSDRAPDEADLEDLARKYRPQLDIYDRALQKILGIDSSRVALRIIFTHAAQVVTLKSR